jgi:hypothetical protein
MADTIIDRFFAALGFGDAEAALKLVVLDATFGCSSALIPFSLHTR